LAVDFVANNAADSAAAIAAMKSSSNTPATSAARVEAPASSLDILADLCAHGDEFVAAAGGCGGRGNRTFASGGNRSPRKTEPGTAGGFAKCAAALRALCITLLFLSRGVHVRVGAASDCGRRLGQCHAMARAVNEIEPFCNRSAGQTRGRARCWLPSATPSRKLHPSPSLL
jgi:hypothetical protein